MLSQQRYLNTFALISFNKDNTKNSIKYEYFMDPGDNYFDKKEDENKLFIENDEKRKDVFKKYWIKRDNANNEYVIFSIGYLNEESNDDLFIESFIGPFDSIDELEIWAKNNDIKISKNKV